ncbi:MAG: radical SAM protein [Desulfococcaceae bacterium]|jgi:KamA family protein|nr:radical SAM protein [Desulfococcaceae bacterium]
MYIENNYLCGAFTYSGEEIRIPLPGLVNHMIAFLDICGDPSLLGKEFCEITGKGEGESKFLHLLKAAGYEKDTEGFCSALLAKLEKADCHNFPSPDVDGVVLPPLFLMAVLEKLLPGNRFISIRNVEQLEKINNAPLPEDQRADMQKVLNTYPVRLSMHTIRQMRVSKNVACQYMPFVEELDPVGHTNTWIGQFHQGLLEQMYQNRVIFLLNMSCPVYCRFCFRKHKESRNQENPSPSDVRRAVEHVRNSPGIKEIVIIGGDPFMNRDNIAAAIDGLMEIPHVQTLRLATRSVAYYPHLFLSDNAELLEYLKLKNLALQQKGKRMEVATHFIHPDEISPESLDIISDLVSSGIAVYIQTPFLKDCNDQGPELARLFSLLRGAGAELHYIYIPCSPIHGNSIYWTSLSKGIEAGRYLRAHVSDRVTPRICTATPIGKMDWFSSGWAVEPDAENENFIWIRTPYTPDYFRAFAPIANESDMVRVNEEGTIDARYMADIGDASLFLGKRKMGEKKILRTDSDALKNFQQLFVKDQRIPGSMVRTGSPTLYRIHKTRVEMEIDGGDGDIAYIREHEEIRDVVLSSDRDAAERLHRIEEIIRALQEIPHVNAVRLRSFQFNYFPEIYTRSVIRRLQTLNRLTVVNPLRLEIETMFLHSDEIRPEHKILARELLNRGISVYSNTPLLGGINDGDEEISRLAFRLRESGIEFHHLYVAGLPLQSAWNTAHPVDVSEVTDIAGRVRREGSGREIPRYIIWTSLGETDFGLSSRLYRSEKGEMFVKLLPYSLEYYQQMEPEFVWPEGVTCDSENRPVIQMPGLISSENFMTEIIRA